MSSPPQARLATATQEFVEQATADELDDWLTYYDPDLVLLTSESAAPRAASKLHRQLQPETTLFQPNGTAPSNEIQTINGLQFVLASTPTALADLAGEVRTAGTPGGSHVFVVSGLLELDIDQTTLSTSLVGREEYETALPGGCDATDFVHISTRLPGQYRRKWGQLSIVGGGAESGHAGTPLVALDCRSDGRVLTRELSRSRLGLEAVDGVGETRAQRLRDAGFTDRSALATADSTTLAEIPGLGQKTVDRIQASARAIAKDEIVCEATDSLPSGDPIYIDIETDGLSPTITWLIGVLDGCAADGHYMAFLQRDPTAPGKAVEDFMAWYTVNASHRPLVAYGGWNFDFTVLHDHIIEYCPHYDADWQRTYRFDPYQWAVKDGNAILPGRTNKLEDVAAGLGYERAETGLTGAAVARAYQQWMVDQSPETELDWERFKTYCEDDVRALAVVYEALEEENRIISTDETSRDVSETTTQGDLSDW